MKINYIELVNFRNYSQQKLFFKDGINVLIGNNAQGKTNLLEAIFLCTIGKSPRTNKDKDLIFWNKKLSKINLNFSKLSGKKNIDIYLSTSQNKSVLINGVPVKRIGQLLGEFNSIYFSPDELKLVKESPDERRRFMDIDLSQFDKNYFYALNKYNKILQQRNKLLKTSISLESVKDTISIWNEQLAKCATFIILKRLNLIEKLNIHANQILNFLTDQKEGLILEYTGLKIKNEEELKQELIKKYEESLQKDYELGYTTVGPHKDDFKIIVNNIDIRHFGSQGQQRTCALALKLAELEVFKDNLGEYPVLLLDDVLSELDNNRQLKLLKKISNIQTIITGTSFNFSVPHTKFVVENGKISTKN